VFVVALCAALVFAGVVIVTRWGAGAPQPARSAARSRLARLARYGAIMAAAGVLAGLLAAGAGGRVAMRVLALTAAPDMQGMVTEGGAVIGDITLGGTLAFIAFAGVLSGLLTGGLYALMLPLLPRGRAGGLLLGAIVLVLAGSRLDPLRSDNFDFALVSPDWLSVLLFTAVALFQGLLVVALAGRMSAGAPPLRPVASVRRAIAAGRITAAVVVLAALPGFVAAVADILTSSA
jgi:hypothetical protein